MMKLPRKGLVVGIVLPATFGIVLSLAVGLKEARSADKTQVTIYKVPTSGKILDVIYAPEFDEWWIKCREKDGIAVYTYDRRTGKWGKALFEPGKRSTGTSGKESPAKREAAAKESKETAGNRVKPSEDQKAQEKTESKPATSKTGPEKLSTPHPEQKPEAKPGKKKWWNPLNLLEKTKERLLSTPLQKNEHKSKQIEFGG
jgi:hypothetical protein